MYFLTSMGTDGDWFLFPILACNYVCLKKAVLTLFMVVVNSNDQYRGAKLSSIKSNTKTLEIWIHLYINHTKFWETHTLIIYQQKGSVNNIIYTKQNIIAAFENYYIFLPNIPESFFFCLYTFHTRNILLE